MPRALQPDIPLRIVVVNPVPGVLLRLQGGRSDLLAPSRVSPAEVTFHLTVRTGPPRAGGQLNFLGTFAQGPPASRFISVNAGRQAGQPDTACDRRAKIPLLAITRDQVAAVLAAPRALLEVHVSGRAADGGPACASVPLLAPGWRVRVDAVV